MAYLTNKVCLYPHPTFSAFISRTWEDEGWRGWRREKEVLLMREYSTVLTDVER